MGLAPESTLKRRLSPCCNVRVLHDVHRSPVLITAFMCDLTEVPVLLHASTSMDQVVGIREMCAFNLNGQTGQEIS